VTSLTVLVTKVAARVNGRPIGLQRRLCQCGHVCRLRVFNCPPDKNQNSWNCNYQTCHRDSPSWVLTDQLILLGQKVKVTGHNVQKHRRPAGVSYALCRVASVWLCTHDWSQ